MSFRGEEPPDPYQGDGVSGEQCMVWEFIERNYIKSKLIKFNIITDMLKMHESADMIKTEAMQKDLEWSWEFYPPKQVFLDFLLSAKTHELPGAPPLPPRDPRQGRCPWTPRALRRAPGPHPCWVSRQVSRGAGYAHTLSHLGIRGKWKCAPPHNILRTPLCPYHAT